MKPGDKVKIKTSDGSHEGVVMPSSDETLVLKLSSGYNLGISRKKIVKADILEPAKSKDVVQKKDLKTDPKKPTIAVLHTGGTIASKVDYESGAVTAKFGADDLVAMAPELKKIANIETELVANMMSEDMNFPDHQKIAKAALKWARLGVKGIIIGHGTDTLSYTAASLSFMFEKINVPILIVGSQRSTDRGSSDGIMNLVCAARFISHTDFCGVATCLHHSSSDDKCAIILGTKARKMHTSARDAFKAINDTPIALVDVHGKIECLREYPKGEKEIVLKPEMSLSVGLLKTHPSLSLKLLQFYTANYNAIVIEGTGLGHVPTNTPENLDKYEVLKAYLAKGGIVAMTSQCIYGRVHPHVYTNLRRLSSIGVIYCEDMLPETAFLKMSWLLANYPVKVRELMIRNLKGEITERSQ
jgi:glutamyl-tRNA(Gln) amidotransferase subunit D